ncbi:hypothetical protein [Kordiimonas laminariae]|uniref:hypothetical protein n=1 Tax=Kordiimonas laminariae TaxID=2917717 RepID=UPI001FF608D7|nr:hypothetical protein [Kordiimonas laminariae]MCK0071202.1 hypothetical protein [Kordiimonas laminariae]
MDLKEIFAQFNRVVDFKEGRNTRIIMEADGPLIEIFDPRKNQERLIIHELKIWSKIPGLMDIVLKQFQEHITSPTVDSTMTRVEYAKRSQKFAEWLIVEELECLEIGDLSVSLLNDYVNFLITKYDSATATLLYHPVRSLYNYILSDRTLDTVRDPYLFAPRNPFWRHASRGGAIDVIPDPVFADMLKLAKIDCQKIISRQKAFWKYCEKNEPIDEARKLSSTFEVAHHILDRYGTRLPSKKEFKSTDKTLMCRLSGKAGVCGYKDVVSLIHPTLYDLLPFIVVLAVYTQFNLSVMLALNLDDIDFFKDNSGKSDDQRVLISGYKGRARRMQRRSFVMDDEFDNPGNIINFLKRYTQNIRPYLDRKVQNRVFAFWSLKKGQTAGSYPAVFEDSRTKEAVSDGRFPTAYKTYWRKKGQEFSYNYSSIRPTALNLFYRAYNGDIVATATLANHQQLETFVTNYQSSSAIAINDSKMSQALLLRERMLATEGKFDPTRQSGDEGVDAVTPGFRCLDPLESPMPGQKSNRLCTAYGSCPACPLASVDVKSAISLARLIQLEQQYIDAREKLEVLYWRDKYQPQLDTLQTYWLKMFSVDVFDRAKALEVRTLAEIV